MKKIINTILFTALCSTIIFPIGVFAQYDYDYSSGGNSYDYNYTTGNTYDYSYSSTGNTYDYNNTTVTSPATYTGNTYDYNYVTPASNSNTYTGNTYDYNYTTPTSGNVYTGNTYDYNYTTPVTGGNVWTGNTYTTPTVSNYGFTDYSSAYSNYLNPTNYGGYGSYIYPSTYSNYLNPTVIGGYVNPTIYTNTTVNTCPSGSTLVNGVCQINTTTCPSGTTLVNGSCQINTTTCPTGTTLVNGSCVTNTTTCPTGTSLVNGSCVSNTTSCPSGSSLVNGSCVSNTTTCPSGSSLVNGSCVSNTTTCPAGTSLVNGVCQINTTTCPSGTFLTNGTCQMVGNYTNYLNPTTAVGYINPTTIANTVYANNTNQTCWNGSIISSYYSCPSQYKTCNNGSVVPISQSCYKICSNGISVPDYTSCYRTCPDGSSVADYQSCPVYASLPWVDLNVNRTSAPYGGSVNLSWSSQNASYCVATNGWGGNKYINGNESHLVYGPTTYTITCYNSQGQSSSDSVNVFTGSQAISFNNVVTSVVTQITNTSARCNGIGLVANNAKSTGWFEYGETANLGRNTAQASIGSDYTSPFSNVLANLKSDTNYYCRAVMSNQYGTVKGEIVKFTTRSQAVSYVEPKVITKTTTSKKVTTTKKADEYICADGSTARIASTKSAELLNNGQKLITVSLDKVTGSLSPKGIAVYRLVYKNITDVSLNNVMIKVIVPQEFTFVSSTVGNYDDTTHTLTFNQNTIEAYTEGIVNWNTKVKDDAQLGKAIVTTGYVSYTIPSNKDIPLQDEVTAYSVGSITPDMGGDTGAKNVIGTSSKSFLPDNLVEWFALLAIMFILFILGRSIYATYQEEEKK